MNIVIIVAAVLVVAATCAVFLRGPRQEDLSSHQNEDRDQSTSDQLYGRADRPAGPDAEM